MVKIIEKLNAGCEHLKNQCSAQCPQELTTQLNRKLDQVKSIVNDYVNLPLFGKAGFTLLCLFTIKNSPYLESFGAIAMHHGLKCNSYAPIKTLKDCEQVTGVLEVDSEKDFIVDTAVVAIALIISRLILSGVFTHIKPISLKQIPLPIFVSALAYFGVPSEPSRPAGELGSSGAFRSAGGIASGGSFDDPDAQRGAYADADADADAKRAAAADAAAKRAADSKHRCLSLSDHPAGESSRPDHP